MSYQNPLHPIVRSSSHSYALTSDNPHFTHTAVDNVGPGAASKFALPNRHRVPQRVFAPKHTLGSSRGPLQAPITFDYPRYTHQGVPMKVFGSGETPIIGARDEVFTKPGVARITFHILWPGYPQVEWYRSVEIDTKIGPMTRAQLGYVVAGNFIRFIEKTQYEKITLPDQLWRVGNDGIRFENLVLLSVWNTYENSWQAEVAVDF